MTDTSANSKRIAKNTLMLYFRMLFKMLVTLYTSRVVLDFLGVTDFGIYNVVGGIVILFNFIVGSMTVAVQRFLSYEIGKNELNKVSNIFHTAIQINAILAIIIFIIAETIGLLLFYKLNIPADRIEAAKWVFHISIINSCINFTQIPYTALIVAYEKMNIYAYVGIIEITFKLLVVFLLPVLPFDKLVSYAILIFIVSLLIRITYNIYCKKRLYQGKFYLRLDKQIFKELFSFASWSLLGELAWSASGQGTNIVLNLFFSPAINTARAIAMQVLSAVKQFILNFQTAINPQIIKLYSSGNYNEMFKLSFNGIRLSFFLMLLISMPILLNMQYILSLWLKTVPESSALFCQLTIIGLFCDILSNILSTISKATGKIKKYQLITSVIIFSNLPLSYFFLKLKFPAYSVFVIYIVLSITLTIANILLLKSLMNFPLNSYAKTVILPIIKTTIPAIIIPITISWIIPNHENIKYLCLSTSISTISSCFCIFFIGLKQKERQFILLKLHLKKHKTIC